MSPTPASGKPDEAGAPLKPGDEAVPGTPGTGEDLCPACGGSGKLKNGSECPTCEGTGRIVQGIGGG